MLFPWGQGGRQTDKSQTFIQIKVKKNRQTYKQKMFLTKDVFLNTSETAEVKFIYCVKRLIDCDRQTDRQTDIWTEIPAKTCSKVDTLKVKPSQN